MIFVGHEVSQLKLGLLVNILNYDDVENSTQYILICVLNWELAKHQHKLHGFSTRITFILIIALDTWYIECIQFWIVVKGMLYLVNSFPAMGPYMGPPRPQASFRQL
jgi:hypothetical protein